MTRKRNKLHVWVYEANKQKCNPEHQELINKKISAQTSKEIDALEICDPQTQQIIQVKKMRELTEYNNRLVWVTLKEDIFTKCPKSWIKIIEEQLLPGKTTGEIDIDGKKITVELKKNCQINSHKYGHKKVWLITKTTIQCNAEEIQQIEQYLKQNSNQKDTAKITYEGKEVSVELKPTYIMQRRKQRNCWIDEDTKNLCSKEEITEIYKKDRLAELSNKVTIYINGKHKNVKRITKDKYTKKYKTIPIINTTPILNYYYATTSNLGKRELNNKETETPTPKKNKMDLNYLMN